MDEFYRLTFVVYVDDTFYGRYCHDSEVVEEIYNFTNSNDLLLSTEVEVIPRSIKFTVKRPCKQGESKNSTGSVMCADLVNKLREELRDARKIEVTVMYNKMEHRGTYEQY